MYLDEDAIPLATTLCRQGGEVVTPAICEGSRAAGKPVP
jgi:hypothetical protein